MEDRPKSPEWLGMDPMALQATIIRTPERRDIDLPLNEQLIVEYYSR
jgi:small subunit ribosomal protein S4